MIRFVRSLWSLRHMRLHLAHEGLTSTERFGYLLLWAIWQTMDSVSAIELTTPTKVFLYVVAAVGIIWAYVRNGGSEGHALIDRYLSLSMLISLRVTFVVRVVLQLIMTVHQVTNGMFAPLSALQSLFLDAAPDGGEDGGGTDMFAELVIMGACTWVAWSIGHQLGKVREAAGDAHGLAPVASMSSMPRATVAGGYGGWTAGSAAAPTQPVATIAPAAAAGLRPLDRFVERVVQSELAAKSSKRPAKTAPAKSPARPRRKSSVRLIRARRPGR